MDSTLSLSLGLEIADTDAEGPGRRYAVWVQGCPLRCAGCCNPEMLRFEGGYPSTVDEVAQRIANAQEEHRIVGLSLLGGEPFAQAEAGAELARRTQDLGLDVMVYTGFELADLRARGEPAVHTLLERTDLLVDGPFDRNQPDRTRRWIGSRNQQLHRLSDRYTADDPRFVARETVEIRLRAGELVINGKPWGPGLP